MKSIKELRNVLRFIPREINSSLAFFADKCKIDFDVYLPSRGKNLQRGYVWTIEQKREIIWSILMNRHIPRMAMVNVVCGKYDIEGTYQIIDGKQRLSAMIDFYKGKFDLIIEGKSYLFADLPEDYRRVISAYMFPYYIVHEDFGNTITDDDKVNWFRYINFAGTPQDAAHMDGLNVLKKADDYEAVLEEYEESLYCTECGNDSKKTFIYQRTVANGEVWFCKKCKKENLTNEKPKEDDYC